MRNLRFIIILSFICSIFIPSKAQSLLTLGDSLLFSPYRYKPTLLKNISPFKINNYDFQYNPITKLFYVQNTNSTFHPTDFLNRDQYLNLQKKYILKKNWDTLYNHQVTPKKEDLSLIKPIEINSAVFSRIFGGNTIEITPKGNIDLSIFAQRNTNQNPILNERYRKLWGIDFDQQLHLNLNGKIGERGKLTANFGTDAEFDFENFIRFDYTGKQDDILQKLEIGNVNFITNSRLINNSEALFGVKTMIQLGRLNMTTVLSQQRSKRHEIHINNGRSEQTVRIPLSKYDYNQHYFLGHYFRENYNKSLQASPLINTPIQITHIEVWVSNLNNKTDGARDILALLDLGEKNPYNSNINAINCTIFPNSNNPNNQISNDLLVQLGENGRNPNNNFVQTFFNTDGDNYAKITAAKKLTESIDYTIHRKLGYISLANPLLQDQVLAVSYRYIANGKEYQVGEFSTESSFDTNNPTLLYTKLLKNEVLKTNLPTWDLMMKNIYNLGSSNINESDIRLHIARLDDHSSTENPILKEGINIVNKSWLEITGLDKLTSNGMSGIDGNIDFLEGITIDNKKGKLIFPVIEPFGKDLASQFNPSEQGLIDKYVFQELYTLTQDDAIKMYSDKNRYTLNGTIQSNNTSEYTLGTFNLKPNSIKVSNGAIQLIENVDYTIDYEIGILRIINPVLLTNNNTIKIAIEDESIFGSQQKTFIANRLDFKVNPNLTIGSTFMKLTEKPFNEKVRIGNESISNTMLSADISYSKNSKWLTRLLDKLPFYKTNEQSTIQFYAEVAHLRPSYARGIQDGKNGVAYIDDFENNFSLIDLKNQQGWQISGTPQIFTEHALTNDLAYGYNRAHLAFYNIDPVFYQASNLNPNINDKYLLDPRTRKVTEQEVFPFKELKTGTDAFLPTLDLAFYPMRRGPYNFTTTNIDQNDNLLLPRNRWAGIMKKIDQTDFESQNISYLEMWVMDPRLTNYDKAGGDIYINLGNISEDILKDGRKSLENAIPSDGDKTVLDKTNWGYVTKTNPISNTFESSDNARFNQDVGLDGLNSLEESTWHSDFLNRMKNILSNSAFTRLLHDPANDDYVYFRGNHFNRENGILERYYRINGTEGNSKTRNQSITSYDVESSARTLHPDGEDLSRDNSMNEADNYFEYKISTRPQDMVVGKNYIVDEVTSSIRVLNKNRETKWYKLRIPIRDYEKKYGNINDFKSIRYIRLFLTNHADTAIVRFARLQFVKSDWQIYNAANTSTYVIADPSMGNSPPADQSAIELSAISIEENGKRIPIPYTVPPNINRQVDYANNNLDIQLNEQSLSLKINNLQKGYGRAAFKNANFDLRQYGYLEMFVHAEGENLLDDQARGFIRLGTDDRNHYYEYEAPLKITPYGTTAPSLIWPTENNIAIKLDLLIEAKLARDKSLKNGQIWPLDEPFEYSDGKNRILVKGNPDLSKIKFYMLGIKNSLHNSNSTNNHSISGEFWFNELRLTDFSSKSSWAATSQLQLKLADLGNISISGTKLSSGFGDIAASNGQRNRNDRLSLDLSTNAEIGKFFNPNYGLSIPLYFSISKQIATPEYNPFKGDVLLQKSLEQLSQKAKDSLLHIIQDYSFRKNFSIMNARKKNLSFDKMTQPWDIENWSFSYIFNEYLHRDIYTYNNTQRNHRGSIDYTFNPTNIDFKEPFKNKQSLLKHINYNLLPSLLQFRLDVNRVYQENTFRDNANDNILPTYYNKNFNTNRIYGISWDLTKSLRIDFNATNYAIIDEPNGRLDGAKKDTLWNNFWRLGRNMDYNHMMNLTYTLPTNKIRNLEWINIITRYGSQFNWQSEPLNLLKDKSINFGNSIQNNRTIQINPSLNFNVLYNKFKSNHKDIDNKLKSTLINLITSIKTANGAYTRVEGSYLPGYMPNSNILGHSFSQNAPGWDFIFGSQLDILGRAITNNWLTSDTLQYNLYTKSYSENISSIIHIEPLPGLKIDITANRISNTNQSSQLSLSNRLTYETGNYVVSQIGLKNTFQNSSKLYRQFTQNKLFISEILGERNPNSNGTNADFYKDGYNDNQQDVVLNAFYKTYLHRSNFKYLAAKPNFPAPNWRLNYNGLAKVLGITDLINNINITHTYQSQFTIGNYYSNSNFELSEGNPYIRDRNKNFIPAYQYNQITLTDRFLPLIGVDVRLYNNMNINTEYRRIRDINLSLENGQMSILHEQSYIAGFGFRKLNTLLPFGIMANKNWKNDLNARIDFALNDRKVAVYRNGIHLEEITAGNKNITLNPSIDYTINRYYNIRIFYNSNVVKPYTSSSFASSYAYFGFQLKLLLQ